MKKVSWTAFLAALSEDVRERVAESAERLEATGAALFVNQQLDSSSLGESSVLLFGPKLTYKGPDDLVGKWLFDLPSQRQYAQEFALREEQ
jgi:hypothetical protein